MAAAISPSISEAELAVNSDSLPCCTNVAVIHRLPAIPYTYMSTDIVISHTAGAGIAMSALLSVSDFNLQGWSYKVKSVQTTYQCSAFSFKLQVKFKENNICEGGAILVASQSGFRTMSSIWLNPTHQQMSK